MAKTEPTKDAAGAIPSGMPEAKAAQSSAPVSDAAGQDLAKQDPSKPQAAGSASADPVKSLISDPKPADPSALTKAAVDAPPVSLQAPSWSGEAPKSGAKDRAATSRDTSATEKPAEPSAAFKPSALPPKSDLPPELSAESAPAPRRSAMPMLLAGVVTAGLGLGAGWALWGPNGFLAGQSTLETRLAALEGELASVTSAAKSSAEAAAKAAVDPIAAQLSAAQSSLSDLQGLAASITALEGQSQQASAAVAALDAKLTELSQRPPESDPAAVAAYERELAALRATFSTELSAIKAASDQSLTEIRATLGSELSRIDAEAKAASEASEEAAKLQVAAERSAALAALGAALESGISLADPLTRLTAAAPDLPVASLEAYKEGVPTLLSLQEAFPAAARAALSAETMSGGEAGSIGGALKGFLGMRSLAPKDGTSTDAILSRAEAALASGDLAATFAQLDALSAAPAAQMQVWRAEAERRLAAMSAYKTLSDAVEK